MSELTSNISVQNITVPPITTMLDHLAAANPHPQYALKTDFPSLVATLITLSDIRDVVVPNADISDCVLTWKDAAWRPTRLVDVLDVNDVPYATTAAKGVVRLAAQTDYTNRNTSAVVTANGFRSYLDDNGYTDAVTQKLQVMRTPEQVISAINNGSTNVVSGMELDGGANQYVVVTYPKFNAGEIPGLVTESTVWASSRYGYVSEVVNQNYANITVYRNGWIKDYVLKDELSSAVGATVVRKPIEIVLAEDAHGYDLTVKNGNQIVVHNNAKVNRLMVSSNGAAFIEGTAHEVKLIGNNMTEARMVVMNNGHAEYVTIESGARLEAYAGGIVEHIEARNTFFGDNCAIQVTDTAKIYHMSLSSANAIIYSGGYAEDVMLYEGAYLTIESGGIVRDLHAYRGANIEVRDGAIIDGFVRYQPSVTITDGTSKGISTVIKKGALCTITSMPIYLLNKEYASNEYHISYIQSGAGYQEAGVSRVQKYDAYTWTRYSGGRASNQTELAGLPPAAAFYPDVAPSYSNKVTNFSEYYNTAGSQIDVVTNGYVSTYETPVDPLQAKVFVPAFEAPKGFLRIMPEAVRKIETATAEIMETSGAELYSSAYQYYQVQSITGYRPTGDPDIALYSVVPPEGFFETFTSNYEWYVTF